MLIICGDFIFCCVAFNRLISINVSVNFYDLSRREKEIWGLKRVETGCDPNLTSISCVARNDFNTIKDSSSG